MGERMELGDRDPRADADAVGLDRNGGFSSAHCGELYLPMIEDGEYGFRARNVGAQREDESSFLCWLRNLLVLRRSMPFGTGTFEQVDTGHESVFGYVRDDGGCRMLCLVNLATERSTTAFAEDAYVGRLELAAGSSGVESPTTSSSAATAGRGAASSTLWSATSGPARLGPSARGPPASGTSTVCSNRAHRSRCPRHLLARRAAAVARGATVVRRRWVGPDLRRRAPRRPPRRVLPDVGVVPDRDDRGRRNGGDLPAAPGPRRVVPRGPPPHRRWRRSRPTPTTPR